MSLCIKLIGQQEAGVVARITAWLDDGCFVKSWVRAGSWEVLAGFCPGEGGSHVDSFSVVVTMQFGKKSSTKEPKVQHQEVEKNHFACSNRLTNYLW